MPVGYPWIMAATPVKRRARERSRVRKTPDALRWRRKRDAERRLLLRRHRRGALQRESTLVCAFVLCPLRRERQLGLFSAARTSLSEAGIHPSAVRRMQGIDLLVGRDRDRGQTARSVVRASVFRDFIPKALL